MQTLDLPFLQNKIASTGTALFFCDNKYMLPFSAYIITALKTDDQGVIWFFINRSWNKTVSYNISSSASLDFYRKGSLFSLKIEGRAELVNDKTIMQEFMQDLLGKSLPVKEDVLSGVLLVKVKIENADYREFVTRKSYSPLDNISSAIRNLWHPIHSPQTQLQPSL
jgi:general stress protein 26